MSFLEKKWVIPHVGHVILCLALEARTALMISVGSRAVRSGIAPRDLATRLHL